MLFPYPCVYELYWEIRPSCWVGLWRFLVGSRLGGGVQFLFPKQRELFLAWWHPARFWRVTVCFSVDVHMCSYTHTSVTGEGAGTLCAPRSRDFG